MVIVHHLENSRSQRVLWMLEELGADYEVKRYDRDKKTNLAPAALKAVHPLGKSPVIEDDGRIIAETGAIIEYLIDRFDSQGNFRPAPGTDDFHQYRYWLHYAEGSAFPPLLLKLVFRLMTEAPMPFFVKPVAKGLAKGVMKQFIDPQIKLHYDFVEGELGKSTWFAGNALSGADIMMSFPLEALLSRSEGNARPNIEAFLDRIHARPAYKRALERGGPYGILGSDR